MDYIKILKNSALFYGLSEEEINKALKYSKMGICGYKKGTYVFNSGDVIKNIGLVVEGTLTASVELLKEILFQFWRKRHIYLTKK